LLKVKVLELLYIINFEIYRVITTSLNPFWSNGFGADVSGFDSKH